MNPLAQLSFSVDDRINDVKVGPDHVPLALLGEFQKDVADFLRGSSRDVDVGDVQIAIQSGSLKLVASGIVSAMTLWDDLAQLAQQASLSRIDPRRASVIERWQTQARQHPHRQYKVFDQPDQAFIQVNALTSFKVPEAIWVRVEKYLHGKVVDLGGKTRANVHLELETGETLTIAANQDLLANEEINRLYRESVLHITAEENLATGELRNAQLIGFAPYHPRYDESAMRLLVERGTKAWADVPDSDAWLESIRGN